MKKASLLTALAICALALTGCISTNTSDAGNLTLNPQTTGPLDQYRPLYKVDEKNTVSGNAKLHWCLGFTWGANGYADYANTVGEDDGFLAKFLPSTKDKATKAAFYNACEANQCDSVVASRYTIKTKDYFVYANYDVTITGYPATQIGLETVEAVPYYIDPAGKLIILEKFVNMHNVMPCPKKDKGWAF